LLRGSRMNILSADQVAELQAKWPS